MSKPVLLSLGAGKVQELAGTANNDVLTWNSATSEWVSAAGGGGGGSGTVTSVGLTGGTSGIVIGGTTSPITTSGTYNLDAPQRFSFDTTSPIAPTSPGQISWNATEGSLNTLMAGGNVDAIVGQQLYQRVVNADTETLTKGMVVYVEGSSGTRVTVKRATASADLTSATIIGVVAESIAVNATGFIITEGTLKDLDVLPSTTFADGDVVYLSPTTAGGLTPTKPTAPQHLVMVGYCVKASNGAAGVLLVKTQNGYELGELHDVYINSPTSGQILIYDATSGQTRWENASLTGGTGVTVTPGPGSLSVAIGQSVATGASPTFAGLTLTGFSGLVRATTGVLAGGATVALGSEVSGTLPVANGGTGATSTSQNYVFAGPTSGSGAPSFRALVAGDLPAIAAPYDVLGRFAGNPASSAVLYSAPVPRAVTVSTTTGNHYFYASALPSSGTSVITVYKTLASNGTKSALFTATWTAGQAAASNGLYQAVIGTVSNNTLVAGDVLSVEMGPSNAAFVNPQFAVSATA